jgi:DNA invertase Pin-like site-specific DNA recombinase
MNVGFLRNTDSSEQLQEEIAKLEKAGCERIVVDNNAVSDPHEGMLGALISRMSSGDALVVLSLDTITNSMPELVDLVLEMEAKNLRLQSLAEGFDSHGKHRASTKALFSQLLQFQQQLEARLRNEAATLSARRVGRPKSLSTEQIEAAREMVKGGRPMDEVAQHFGISRATLYRYLE